VRPADAATILVVDDAHIRDLDDLLRHVVDALVRQ
jgi:hypothetical protein